MLRGEGKGKLHLSFSDIFSIQGFQNRHIDLSVCAETLSASSQQAELWPREAGRLVLNKEEKGNERIS